MRNLSKASIAIGTTAVVVVSAGVAYAWWTTTGTGGGTATTGTVSQNLGLTATQVTGTDRLYPGGSPVALKVAVSNPNTYSVSLAGTTAAITAGSIKCDTTTVPDAWFTLASSTISATGITPPQAGATPGAATLNPSGLTVQFNDAPAADQNICKNASVTFSLTTT